MYGPFEDKSKSIKNGWTNSEQLIDYVYDSWQHEHPIVVHKGISPPSIANNKNLHLEHGTHSGSIILREPSDKDSSLNNVDRRKPKVKDDL